MSGINPFWLSTWVVVVVLSSNTFPVTAETSLSLTITPNEITAGITQNISIRCERHGTSAAMSNEMWWFRIAKKKASDDWVNIADYRMDGSIVNSMGTKAAGHLNPSDWLGYLQVNWEEATEDTFGTFRCEFFGVTINSWFATDKSPEVVISETLNANTLVHFWNDINDESGNLGSCLGYGGSETNKFQLKISRLGRNIDKYVTDRKDADDTLWTRGRYSLLMPESGCPASFMNDTDSYLKFHEASFSGTTCLQRTNNLHLSKPIDEHDGSDCFINLRFCESMAELVEVPWPSGKYCINKLLNESCPTGFSNGYLEIDAYGKGITIGNTAQSFIYYSYLYFCCRHSSSHNTPMILPKYEPFYLYRYGGACQKVQGMTEIHEVIDIDTENGNGNSDKATDSHPDVDISVGNPTKIHLCYYKPSN